MNLFTDSVEPVISAVFVFALPEHSAVWHVRDFERVAASHAGLDVFVRPEARLIASGCVRAVGVFHLEAFFATEDDYISCFESIHRTVKDDFGLANALRSGIYYDKK